MNPFSVVNSGSPDVAGHCLRNIVDFDFGVPEWLKMILMPPLMTVTDHCSGLGNDFHVSSFLKQEKPWMTLFHVSQGSKITITVFMVDYLIYRLSVPPNRVTLNENVIVIT